MPIVNRIAEFHADLTTWRRDIHRHPETAFQEQRTSAFVAERLAAFGIEVHRGLAGTGVVGTLRGGRGAGAAIGLRADMDALDMVEKNNFAHRSSVPGKMHGCGHDGHTTMLLGAARYLAESRNFAGTVHFIFQPAEENEGGGRVMIEQGLFKSFPMAAVYGMHNMPGMEVGEFAVRPGPVMAAFDVFEIKIQGRGTHAAVPHLGTDAVVAAAHIVTALQTIVARAIDPLEAAVVSVTQFHAGDTWNVIPEDVMIRGTARAIKPHIHDSLEPAIRRIVQNLAAALEVTADLHYERRYPPTINDAQEASFAAKVARGVAGEHNVATDKAPMMGAEDFAFMLNERPGAYVWIGNGPGTGGCVLHNPHYDFNDEILPLGASFWARLVEEKLAPR